jgi:hypothetical protein
MYWVDRRRQKKPEVEHEEEFQTRAYKTNQKYSVYREEYGKREAKPQREEIAVLVL